MNVCRYYDPITLLRGCAAGRIADLDCGSGCSVYDPVEREAESDPVIVGMWYGREGKHESD